MASAGILILMVLGGLAIAFATLSARRGSARAFVGLCWVPLAVLALALLGRGALGYGLIAVLLVIVLASLCLSVVGGALAVAALRQRSTSAKPLIWGMMVAAMSLLALVALWAIRTVGAH